MDKTLRSKRLLRVLHKVRDNKRQQDKKIDILCNDIISAHQDFIKKLGTISFSADFYESLMGVSDLREFFCIAGRSIEEKINDCQTAFFLRRQDGFELFMFENQGPKIWTKEQVTSCFTGEVVDNIFKSNKVCDIEEMLGMGLAGSPGLLNKISGYSVPLIRFGSSVGFVLIYRSKENPITESELCDLTAVTPGLSKIVGAYHPLLN
jgi:hypothetical protein